MSASLVNAQSPCDAGRGRGPIPLYYSIAGDAASGYVIDPTTSVFCSWASDAGTMSRMCSPGAPADCAPGCFGLDNKPAWCTGPSDYTMCAYPPTRLSWMLHRQQLAKPASYNEVVVDTASYTARLPDSIEAVFWVKGCKQSGPYCERYAREAHRKLVDHFGLAEGALPLLTFDPMKWDGPFSVPPH